MKNWRWKIILRNALLVSTPLWAFLGLWVYKIFFVPEFPTEESLSQKELIKPLQQYTQGHLWAGFAEVDITPIESSYLAGFALNTKHTSVHRPIQVKCAVLKKSSGTLFILSFDLIGLHRWHVLKMREAIAKTYQLDRENSSILIAATHTHSAPDSLGLWGPFPLISGIDDSYIDLLTQRSQEVVGQALKNLAETQVGWGQKEVLDLNRNIRVAGQVDHTLSVFSFRNRKNKAYQGVVTHFSAHPETLGTGNSILSPDFPGTWGENLKQQGIPVAVFLNGAIGGMVTVDNREESVAEVQRLGDTLAQHTLDILNSPHLSKPISQDNLAFELRKFSFPVQNRTFRLAIALNVFGSPPTFDDQGRPQEFGLMQTELMQWRIGPVRLLTIPGEIFPPLSEEFLEILNRRRPRPSLLIGLANDQLGYIMSEKARQLKGDLYAHEKRKSVGGKLTQILRQQISSLTP